MRITHKKTWDTKEVSFVIYMVIVWIIQDMLIHRIITKFFSLGSKISS